MSEPAVTPPTELEKPDLEITVKLNGTDKTIKMVYGLEMDLRRLLPDPTTAMQLVMMDQFTQDYIVRRCLTDNKKMITDVTELVAEDTIDINSEDVERLMLWALEHTLYFFVKRTSAVGALGVRCQASLPILFKSGSEPSPSTTPSAGPSAS
jgi:hypothetical protein